MIAAVAAAVYQRCQGPVAIGSERARPLADANVHPGEGEARGSCQSWLRAEQEAHLSSFRHLVTDIEPQHRLSPAGIVENHSRSTAVDTDAERQLPIPG